MKYIPDLKDAKGKLIISSHRRSGSHLFLQALRETRTRSGLPDGTIRHWKPAHPFLIRDCDYLDEVVNIVRDGRDVLVSCYYYYQKLERLHKLFKKATFQDYLYGRVEVKNPYRIIGQHWTNRCFMIQLDIGSTLFQVGYRLEY